MDTESVNSKYALKCIYNAHAADVRVVKATNIPDGGILTGSRDNYAKVWISEGTSFKECQMFTGASSFIASLCVLPPSAHYPKGLFLAGSNDCSIYGFTPDSSEPVLRLLGHSGPVCTLSCGNFGYFVSGSWDKSARVWSGQQCILTLQGHLEAVWATDVFSTQNLILTGSADRTIRLWRSGVCEKVFTGHEDCVRGLAIISDMKFLSCSNDSTVRLWLTSGECLEIFKSHSDYIYSIALLSNGIDFVTCGEDQNVKIWKNGTCVQTFVISPKSLWSVATLSDGNLAVGTSDGKVYVFEKVPEDYFERTVALSPRLLSSEEKFANVKSSMYDGETVVMYENLNDTMYICEYNYESGTKIKKERLDFQYISSTFYKKPEEESFGKKFSGKWLNAEKTECAPQYRKGNTCPRDEQILLHLSCPWESQNEQPDKDYVFDVDVENHMYKLAFNKGENPWDVATKFVGEHNLPTDHISQIVDYIIKNTVTTFTNEYFPAKSYLTYLNINLVGLRAKLLEFGELVSNEKQLMEEEVDDLMLLAHYPDLVSGEQMISLDKAFSWNDEYIFPVLDLLRVGVRCKGLSNKISSKEFMNHLLHIFINTKKSVNRVLVEKVICNMFGIDEVEEVLTSYQDKIFESVKERFILGEENIQKAGSALFVNFAIASHNGFNISTDKFCSNIVDVLSHVTDSEAIFRILVALGTVCTRNSLAVSYFRSVNIKNYILKAADKNHNPKTNRVVELLCADF